MNPRVSEVAIIEAHQKVYKGTYKFKNMGHESKKMLNMLVFKIRRCPRLWYYPQFYSIRIRNGYIGYHHHKYEAFFGVVKDDGTYISNVKFTQKKI